MGSFNWNVVGHAGEQSCIVRSAVDWPAVLSYDPELYTENTFPSLGMQRNGKPYFLMILDSVQETHFDR